MKLEKPIAVLVLIQLHKYLPLEFFCCADKFFEPKSIENLVPTDKMKLLKRISSEKEAEHDQKGINKFNGKSYKKRIKYMKLNLAKWLLCRFSIHSNCKYLVFYF